MGFKDNLFEKFIKSCFLIWFHYHVNFICNPGPWHNIHNIGSASPRHGKVICSMLGRGKPCIWCLVLYFDAQNRPRCSAQTALYLLLLCQMRDINRTSRENALSPTYTVRTSRQRSCNQRVKCVLCSMAMIYDLLDGWIDGSVDQRKVCGSGSLLWSGIGWLSSSSTAIPHRSKQYHNTYQIHTYVHNSIHEIIRNF